MEEDLETIQEKLEIIESLCTDDCINKSTVIKPLKYAIENLITRYKELEPVLINNKMYFIDRQLYNEMVDDMIKECVPKSKVKEKIEEYKTMYNNLPKNPKEHMHSKIEYQIAIGVLEELLEE